MPDGHGLLITLLVFSIALAVWGWGIALSERAQRNREAEITDDLVKQLEKVTAERDEAKREHLEASQQAEAGCLRENEVNQLAAKIVQITTPPF